MIKKKTKEKKNRKKQIIGGVAAVIIAVLIYLLPKQLVVATVNGKPIFRWTLIQALEKQGGKQTLDSLITKELVAQEAKKEKAIISDQELDKEVKKLEDQVSQKNQDLDQLLADQGMSRSDLREQIKLQKTAEKLAGKDVKVSDQEVQDYLEKNKSLLSTSTDSEKLKADIKEQLKVTKINKAIQSWLKIIRDKAKINYIRHF